MMILFYFILTPSFHYLVISAYPLAQAIYGVISQVSSYGLLTK
jgi:hypothetical protein